jgi:hypothetical protein
MFSLKNLIFILKGSVIQEERFISDLQECLPTDIPTNYEDFVQTKYFGIVLRISCGALSAV